MASMIAENGTTQKGSVATIENSLSDFVVKDCFRAGALVYRKLTYFAPSVRIIGQFVW
jgi:hypothetical protein